MGGKRMNYRAYFIRGDMIAIAKRNGLVTIAIHYNYNSNTNSCTHTYEFWDIPKKEAIKIIKKYLDN
jgi:hypothetical protein